MNEVLYALGGLAVLVVVVGIILHSKLSAVHAAALAPVSVAIVPAAPAAPAQPAPAPAVPVPLPPGGNTTDATAPGFIPPAAAPAPEPPAPAAPGWSPSPTMKYADCTGQNIPLNLGTTYTITECPASTMVGTNITTLPCDPYILTVNGVGTPKEIQTGQCTVYAIGPTIVVSVAPLTPPGVVNLVLQVHAGA